MDEGQNRADYLIWSLHKMIDDCAMMSNADLDQIYDENGTVLNALETAAERINARIAKYHRG